MGFESYKVAATNQLSAWGQTIHEKAANVSEGTLKKAKGAIGAVAIVSLVKAAYDSYNGDFSYLSNVAPVAAMFVMKTGVDYVQAVKVAANANNFAILKSKVQSAIVNQAKELRPDWTDKTDKAIIALVQQNSYLALPTKKHIDHIASLVGGVYKGDNAVNEAVKDYLNQSRLKSSL